MGTINDLVFQSGQVTRLWFDDGFIAGFTDTFALLINGSNGHTSTFRKVGFSAGYLSPSLGFTIIGMQYSADGGTFTAGAAHEAYYQDNDTGWAAVARTNSKSFGNAGDPGHVSTTGILSRRVNFYVPPGKYAGADILINTGTVQLVAICKLGRV